MTLHQSARTPESQTTTTEATRELLELPDDARQREISAAITEYVKDKYRLSDPTHPMADATGGDLINVCVLAAAWRTRNGHHHDGSQRWTTGRFFIQNATHEFLKSHDGIYVFVVYERHDDGIIPIYERRAYPEAVEAVVDDSDIPWDGRKRIAWSDIIRETGGEL